MMPWVTSLTAPARSAPYCMSHEAAWLFFLISILCIPRCKPVGTVRCCNIQIKKGLAELLGLTYINLEGSLILMLVLQLLKDITHWG